MSVIRTWYWDVSGWNWKRPWRRPRLRFGNAGDIYAADLIRDRYGMSGAIRTESPRLLLVGSIIHSARPGDVICVVGVKHEDESLAPQRGALVLGVRGPMTLERLDRADVDTSTIRFVFDPGMLARRFVPVDSASPMGRIFIPHYREHAQHVGRSLSDVRLVSIDAKPGDIIRAIHEAEVVYTSSLHGAIFAHAVGRPVVLIAPQTEEPIFKYQDHYASVGQPWRQPFADIDEALRAPAPMSAASIDLDLDAFSPPTIDELDSLGIVERNRFGR